MIEVKLIVCLLNLILIHSLECLQYQLRLSYAVAVVPVVDHDVPEGLDPVLDSNDSAPRMRLQGVECIVQLLPRGEVPSQSEEILLFE